MPNATPGGASATVRWQQPVSNGGLRITGYIVTPYIGSTAQTPVLVRADTAYVTLHGLDSKMPYTFTIAAVNADGTGPRSKPSRPITPTRAP
jgi:hypothetical protein